MNRENELLQLFTERVRLWKCDYSLAVEDIFGVYRYVPPEERIPGREYQELWQTEELRGFHEHKRIAIRSGKGVGKTAFTSWVILVTLIVREQPKVLCTAPSSSQMFDVLWTEVRKWIGEIQPAYKPFLAFESTKDKIWLAGFEGTEFATARTARREQPEAFQGYHSKTMLLIADEAAGVDDEVYKAGEGTMSSEGSQTLLIGNPNRVTGYFFDCFHKDKKRWHTRRVSCTESSRVTPDYVDAMLTRWGEESWEYRVGVLGEFPSGNPNGIIPLDFVLRCIGTDYAEVGDYPVLWGLDVAGGGGDYSALCKRQGCRVTERVKRWKNINPMHLVGIVFDDYMATPLHLRPAEIIVDAIGVGHGVANRLKELGLPAVAFNICAGRVPEGFADVKTSLWFKVRDWFEAGASIPEGDDDFTEHLTMQEYTGDSGVARCVSKSQMSKSPDLADALVLTFASRKERVYAQVSNPIASRVRQRGIKVVCDASYAS